MTPTNRAVTPWLLTLSLLACLLPPRAAAAPVFAPSVDFLPDFFQHQKWFKTPPAGAGGDPNWEEGLRPGGWCYYASTLNQFYYFKSKGYDILPNPISVQASWLDTSNAEFPRLVDDFKNLTNAKVCTPRETTKTCTGPADCTQPGDKCEESPALAADAVNRILHARGAGPNHGLRGLVRTELFQDGADVKYKSAGGGDKVFKASTTLFQAAQTILGVGDGIILRLVHPTAVARLWWSGPNINGGNFHAVTLAGYDTGGNGQVLFADPDSNPDPGNADGNKNTNAGWKNVPEANVIGRRFRATDPIPVPANNPTAGDISRRFFVGSLTADQSKLTITDADFNRYDDVTIRKLITLETVKAAVKPPPAPGGPPPGEAKKFQVSPGASSNLPVDRFWLFPAGQRFTGSVSFTLVLNGVPQGSANWSATSIAPGGLDPWGNVRVDGGLAATAASPSEALQNDAYVLEMSYETETEEPINAYDVVLGLGSSPANLRVQTFGGAIDQNFDQVAPLSCSFDTDGDGEADLELADTDANGFCEFPTSKTHLPGVLRFTAEGPVEFHGNTVVEADSIVIEPGAVLRSEVASVPDLTLRSLRGDLVNDGTLDLETGDDLVLRAKGTLDLSHLTGTTLLNVADRVRLEADSGDVVLTPTALAPDGGFAVLGANRVEIRARGFDGGIHVARARIGSTRIDLVTKASLSAIGSKEIRIEDESLVTTNPNRTGLPNGGKITFDSTGPVVITDATEIDAGYRVTIGTRRVGDDVCLSDGITLAAGVPLKPGKIQLTGVDGQVFDDGTTTFTGVISSNGIVPGTCP